MESPSTDAQLVAAILSGRLSAFEALVVHHQDRLYLQALSYLCGEEEARDALQDAFLKAFDQLEALKEPSRFPAWVGRILRNICLNRLRDRRRRAMAESVVERTDTEVHPEPAVIRRAAFQELLSKLPEKSVRALTLHYLEGRSIQEVALRTGTNPFRGETAAVQGAQTASGGGHSYGKRHQEQAGSARGIRSADHCPPFGTGQEGSVVHADG